MKTVDPERIVPGSMMPHRDARHVAIAREVPKDAFGEWVASHKNEVKGMICGMADYKDAAFCPKSRTRSRAKKKGS